ncbi:MAG: hypothetical protein IPF75_19480 [Bacteroidetes bacterium]|nr:hypothetical protein [Bacteroidota bacterium]
MSVLIKAYNYGQNYFTPEKTLYQVLGSDNSCRFYSVLFPDNKKSELVKRRFSEFPQ